MCILNVGIPTPKGSRPVAQGCPRSGKPWACDRGREFQPPRGCVRRAVGVDLFFCARSPRVFRCAADPGLRGETPLGSMSWRIRGVSLFGPLWSLPVCLGTRGGPGRDSRCQHRFRLRRPGRCKATHRGHPAKRTLELTNSARQSAIRCTPHSTSQGMLFPLRPSSSIRCSVLSDLRPSSQSSFH